MTDASKKKESGKKRMGTVPKVPSAEIRPVCLGKIFMHLAFDQKHHIVK
jgi:hypothetical protein